LKTEDQGAEDKSPARRPGEALHAFSEDRFSGWEKVFERCVWSSKTRGNVQNVEIGERNPIRPGKLLALDDAAPPGSPELLSQP
jgi:hypothetical protein